MAENRYLGKPHPEWVDFPLNLPLDATINGMSRERKPIKPQTGLTIHELDVTARDGYAIRVRSYRSSKETSKLPLLIYMHGGGFVTGGLETDDAYCRLLVGEVPIAILSVEYRLAPEHKFPNGWQDCHDVFRWATSDVGQNALEVDLSKGFLLGGTSAGANFVAGIAHFALEEGLPHPITGLVFLAGNFTHPDARSLAHYGRIVSVDEVNDAPGLTRKAIDQFADQYGAPPNDRRLSPLLFDSRANLAKKAYFAVCGWDPRRDEGLLYESLLKEEGIETKLNVYPGLPHCFWTTCPDLPVSKTWEKDLVTGIKWLVE